ncbi:flavodoxin family protein [Chloroflexota bacterium]
MNIVAIVGGPRVEGNTSYLVDQALAEAQKLGIEVEKIMLTNYEIAFCQGHDDCESQPICKLKDDCNSIIEKFRTADGVILASPVHNINVSVQLKAFIDRTRFLRSHNLKIEARYAGLMAIAANAGMEETLTILKRYLESRSNIPPDRILTLGGRARNMGDAEKNATLVEEACHLGRQMAEKLMS